MKFNTKKFMKREWNGISGVGIRNMFLGGKLNLVGSSLWYADGFFSWCTDLSVYFGWIGLSVDYIEFTRLVLNVEFSNSTGA